ncbi:MAG TPA: hypothetical protein V6D48_02030 [Oculatellaceae cyanobacterium]
MNQEPQLTPAQQNLMDFLNRLATTPATNELLAEGYQALDAAVEENQRLQESIADTATAMRNARAVTDE